MKNKEETKCKLIAAVAQIFSTEGYRGLGVNKVAKAAGVSKKLIYRYFGSFQGLVEAYVVKTDYWMLLSAALNHNPVPDNIEDFKNLIKGLMRNQFLQFQSEKEAQELLLWEINEESALMQSIHRMRESIGHKYFEATDAYFGDTPVHFRAVMALIVSGIWYMILHSRKNGTIMSDVNIGIETGRQEIFSAIDLIIDLVFAMKNCS